MPIFLSWLTVLFLPWMLLLVLRRKVLKTPWLGQLTGLYFFIGYSADYYRRVLSLPVCNQGQIKHSRKFKHPYCGEYEVCLETEGVIPTDLADYDVGLTGTISFYDHAKLIFSADIADDPVPGWGWFGDSASHFKILKYDVGRDVPVEAELECVIDLRWSGSVYTQKWGCASLFIKKCGMK